MELDEPALRQVPTAGVVSKPDAHPTSVLVSEVESRLLQRLSAGRQGEMGEPITLDHQALRNKILSSKVGDLSGDAYRKLARIEAADRPEKAPAAGDRVVECGGPRPRSIDDTKPRDDHTTIRHDRLPRRETPRRSGCRQIHLP